MTYQLISLPFRPTINLRGGIESGAQLDVFSAGTTTRVSVYSDAALTTPLTNPVIADSLGVFPDVYYNDQEAVRVRVLQANGSVLSDTDPYAPDPASAEAARDDAATSAAVAVAAATAADASATAATGFADQAETNAAVSLAASGPNYDDTAAGLAATSEGDTFAVDESGIIKVYRHDAGPTATFLRSYPKDADLFAVTAGTRANLKALASASGRRAYLAEEGREGTFIFRSGDYSSEVAGDTQEGVYIKADDTATTSGAWVRQFEGSADVGWFGAAGDGVRLTDGATTSGDATFASASATFTANDIGKHISIEGAGSSGEDHSTTIASVNSSTSIELTSAPSATVSGALFTYGTDDTDAIRAAIFSRKPVQLGAKIYIITGALTFPRGTRLAGLNSRTYGFGDEALYDYTTIKAIGVSGFAFVVTTSQDTFNVTLESIAFEGDNAGSGFTASNPSHFTREVFIRHCTFQRFLIGIDLANSWASRLDNVGSQARTTGLKVTGGTSHTWTHLKLDGGSKATSTEGIRIDGNPTNISITGGFVQNYATLIVYDGDPDVRVSSLDFEFADKCISLGDLSQAKITHQSCTYFSDAGSDIWSVDGVISEGARIYDRDPTGRSQWFGGTSFSFQGWTDPPGVAGTYLADGGGSFNFTSTDARQAFVLQGEYYDRLVDGIDAGLLPFVSFTQSYKKGRGFPTYEQGTFTATLTSGGGTIGVNSGADQLKYTRIGEVVFITGRITATASSPTGALRIGGLPFPAAGLTETADTGTLSVFIDNYASSPSGVPVARLTAGSSEISVYDMDGTNSTDDMAAHIKTNTLIHIGGHYVIDNS